MSKTQLFRFLARAGKDGTDTGGADTGGDDAQAEETIGNGNAARLAMLSRINDINDENDRENLMDINDDGSLSPFVPLPVGDPQDSAVLEQELRRAQEETGLPPEPQPEPAPSPAPGEPAPEPQPEPQPAPISAPASPEQKFKLKVNGQEIEVTQAELVERAQKVSSADAYLSEAARLRREAEQTLKQHRDGTPAPAAPVADPREDLRARVRAIQMGTEDEAIAALEPLLRPAPSLTQDDLGRTVDERLSFKTAVARFETEFTDILNDPVLRDIALRRDQDALARGDTRDYWTRYKDIGEELRQWKAGIAGSRPQPAPMTDNKLARKAQVAPPPKAASVRSPAPVEDDDREESPSEVIARIAAARGGTTHWNRQ